MQIQCACFYHHSRKLHDDIPLHPSAPCGTLKGDRLFAPQAPRCPCRGRSRSSWVNPRIPRKRSDRAKRAACFALCQSKLYVRNMTAKIKGYLQEIVTEKLSTRTKNEVKLVCQFNLIIYAHSGQNHISGFLTIPKFIFWPVTSQIHTLFDLQWFWLSISHIFRMVVF